VTSDEAVGRSIDALSAAGLEYVLVGSFASNFWGAPRATQDVDLVVDFAGTSMRDLLAWLGPGFRLEPQQTFETVTGKRRHIVYVGDGAFTIEVFPVSEDAHDRERFHRRASVALLGRTTFVLSPEDVIVTKLRWAAALNRDKDLADVAGVVAVRRDTIDWPYVRRWCGEHGTRHLLDEILADLGD